MLATMMVAASMVWADIDWSAPNIAISTADELAEFREQVNGGKDFAGQTIMLVNDIDLNGNLDNQWVPIGQRTFSPSVNFPFNGTFDGGVNVVRGVYINRSSCSNLGLFGVVGGVIRDLGVYVDITGGEYVGGLAGWNSGRIENFPMLQEM
jgi:hypothetical protein